MGRKPRVLSARPAADENASGRDGVTVPGCVDLLIVMEGIKGGPVETSRVTNNEALSLAEAIIRAVRAVA